MGGWNILWLVISILLLLGMCFQLFRPYRESNKLEQKVRVSKKDK
jgi:hypothetical protein